MNYKPETLLQGKFYHIYNRGNNGCDSFYNPENYYYFLKLYEKYISPVVETYAWCLLKNHFHILVYTKQQHEISPNSLKFTTVIKPKIIDPSNQFSHFFNAYTQAVNKREKRFGSLFQKPFRRKVVDSDAYFVQLVAYIHNNPVHHGFAGNAKDYKWSSYNTILSQHHTSLDRKYVLSIYGGEQKFIDFHKQPKIDNEFTKFIN